MEDIYEILAKYDELEELKNLERARARSVRKERQERRERKTRLLEINAEKLKGKAIPALLVGVALVGSALFVKGSVDKINSPLSMHILSGDIGSMVSSNDDPIYSGMSILSQNTIRIPKGFYYQHEEIAKDLLKIDDRLFDYAFCTVCDEMGANLNNEVGVGGRSNIDSVIYYLKNIASDKDSSLSSEYVASKLDGVTSLDDFLLKYGFVDKEGKPSLKEFKATCDKNSQVIADILESSIKDKGTHI